MITEAPIQSETKKRETVLTVLKKTILQHYGKNFSELFCQSLENKPKYELHETNWKPKEDILEAMEFHQTPILKETWLNGKREVIDDTLLGLRICLFENGQDYLKIRFRHNQSSDLHALLPAEIIYRTISEDFIHAQKPISPDQVYDLQNLGMGIYTKLHKEFFTRPENLKVKLSASTDINNQLLISSAVYQSL